MLRTMTPSGMRLGVHRVDGIAGQFAYVVQVQYPDNPEWYENTFVSNTYGHEIVIVSASGYQIRVDSDVVDLYGGKLTPAWIRRFYS